MDFELAYTSATEQADLVRSRRVSPVELVEGYLDRIEEFNPALSAYLTVAGEQAMAAAERAEATAGADDSPPFHGVPISVKDLITTAGIRTTRGTAMDADRIPDQDARVVERVKSAGFIVLGKTNTPEFGMAAVTEPLAYPWAHNPWNPERTPGGSSGGAAAAVAAGLCPVAVGTDGGGSIRIPSSLCGDFGIKPTRGRVSAAPEPNHMFSVIGPITRTVADAAALLDVMAGYEAGDAFWAPPPERPFRDEAGRDPGKLRIAASLLPFIDGIEVDAGLVGAFEEMAALLEDLGHEVSDARPEWDAGVTFGAAPVFGAEISSWSDLPPLDTLHPNTRQVIEMGRAVDGPVVMGALAAVARASRTAVAFWDDYDLLLTPTVAIAAPMVGEFQSMEDDPVGVFRYLGLAAFTSAFNMTGQPAVNIPAGFDDGLPMGVQLVGRPGDEAGLVRIAAQIEEARPWAAHRPPGFGGAQS